MCEVSTRCVRFQYLLQYVYCMCAPLHVCFNVCMLYSMYAPQCLCLNLFMFHHIYVLFHVYLLYVRQFHNSHGSLEQHFTRSGVSCCVRPSPPPHRLRVNGCEYCFMAKLNKRSKPRCHCPDSQPGCKHPPKQEPSSSPPTTRQTSSFCRNNAA